MLCNATTSSPAREDPCVITERILCPYEKEEYRLPNRNAEFLLRQARKREGNALRTDCSRRSAVLIRPSSRWLFFLEYGNDDQTQPRSIRFPLARVLNKASPISVSVHPAGSSSSRNVRPLRRDSDSVASIPGASKN